MGSVKYLVLEISDIQFDSLAYLTWPLHSSDKLLSPLQSEREFNNKNKDTADREKIFFIVWFLHINEYLGKKLPN